MRRKKHKRRKNTKAPKHIQLLETIDESDEGCEDTDEAISSDGETGIPWTKLFPPKDYSCLRYDFMDLGTEERSDIDQQDNVRGSEGSQAIKNEAMVVEERSKIM